MQPPPPRAGLAPQLGALPVHKTRRPEVVCHASAWDIDAEDDLRIKMCIEINAEDFQTVHHELGHNFYQRAYKNQDPLYRGSANDGFHEAIGDTIALSITPEYLMKIGLLDKGPDPKGDVGNLMKMALDKVAFLPFGLLIDQWAMEGVRRRNPLPGTQSSLVSRTLRNSTSVPSA